jgi:D-glycero-D-manno-heptose 1,7-bisphosphate phosphatase
MVQVIEASGGHVSALLYCPHRPETGCNCRKPQPGLLFQAADNLKVSLKQSWLVGDYITDIQAGLAAGCKPVLVLTGRGQKALENWSEIQDDQIHPVKPAPVDVSSLSIKQNLLESANFILASEKKVL